MNLGTWCIVSFRLTILRCFQSLSCLEKYNILGNIIRWLWSSKIAVRKCCEMICIVWQHVAASTGTGEGDLKKLCAIIEAVPNIKYICVDVANGYSEHFVQFVRDVRKTFPKHTIMVMTVEKGKKYWIIILCSLIPW